MILDLRSLTPIAVRLFLLGDAKQVNREIRLVRKGTSAKLRMTKVTIKIINEELVDVARLFSFSHIT